MRKIIVLGILLTLILFSGCVNTGNDDRSLPDRESAIPHESKKITPATDMLPPVLHSTEYKPSVPLPYPVNTAGAEDSAFISPDGKTLYFFFTPDPKIPPEKQLLDTVTGIYVTRKEGSTWSKPERVVLQDPGRLALDGCEFVLGTTMWFCSAREGYTGVNMFTAELKGGRWGNWQYAGDTLNKEYGIGEMHITADGKEMYFHSSRAGGKGGLDIWVSRNAGGNWLKPQNVQEVNSPDNEGWPFITQDGSSLWFTRTYLGSPAIFMSEKANSTWQEPKLIISQFAGEPSVDKDGNVFFTHHFYKDSAMLEADIYVAYKK